MQKKLIGGIMYRKFRYQHKKRLQGFKRKLLSFNNENFFFLTSESCVATQEQHLMLSQAFRRISRRSARLSKTRDLLTRCYFYAGIPATKKKAAARMGSSKAPFFRFISRLRANSKIFSAKDLRKFSPNGLFFVRGFIKKLSVRCLVFRNTTFTYF